MGQLTNATITKSFKGKDREGKYGTYRWYDVYTDKSGDQKLSYRHSGNKLVPAVGLKLALIIYEETENDGYINWKITKMTLAEGHDSQPPSQTTQGGNGKGQTQAPASNGNFKDVSISISYAKDIYLKMMEIDPLSFSGKSPNEIARSITLTGWRIYSTMKNPRFDWKLGGNGGAPAGDATPQDDPWLNEVRGVRTWFEEHGQSALYFQVLQSVGGGAQSEEQIVADMRDAVLGVLKEEKSNLEDDIPF